MHTNTRKLSVKIITIFLLFTFCTIGTFAQTVKCPEGYICLTQAEANKARDNAVELQAQREKNTVLEQSLKEKDKSIEEIRETAKKNQDDLKEQLKKTEIELALKTGLLTGAEARIVDLRTMVEFLNKNGRKKCNFLSVCL